MYNRSLDDFKYIIQINFPLSTGIASANLYAEKYPDKPKPHQFVENAKSIIVIGLPFEPGTIKTVLKPDLAALKSEASDKVTDNNSTAVGAERYFLSEENDIIKRELALMGYKVAKFLRKNKWNAFHSPVCKQDGRFRTAPFYHMPAMYLAGMGTLGLNCNIITPEFGPRTFVNSIITDCELPAGKPMEEDLCTKCNLCVENCPIEAIDGNGWKNVYACASYGCCGTCMAICPVGEI